MTLPPEIHLVAPPTTSIPRILFTEKYNDDQAALAHDLNVTAAKVRKYLGDKHGRYHVVRMYDGQVQLLELTGRKPKR